MLDHVNVMSHGVQTPLSHVAAVSVSNLETLTVMPYDTSVSSGISEIRCFYWLCCQILLDLSDVEFFAGPEYAALCCLSDLVFVMCG